MKIIKLSINSPSQGILRQFPDSKITWGDYEFQINKNVKECDFWVVYSKGQKGTDKSLVAPQNLIFISGEPEDVYHYSNKFLRKFNTVITARRDIKHKNMFYSHPAQPWWVGRREEKDGSIEFTMKFNDFLKSPEKSKIISVISSNKAFTKGHNDRIRFVNRLKDHFGDQLDIFGRGVNGFEDKWDTLGQYKYHIALENSSGPDYWTEKLADSFLTETFPFYYGCTNLEKYFPENSYKNLDIHNINKAIEIIEKGLTDNLRESNYKSLIEAKRRVLYQHNLLALIARVCDQMKLNEPKKLITIRYETSYFDPYKIPMLIRRYYYNRFYKI